MVTDEVAQRGVVVALVLQHLFEDGDGGFVAEVLDLLAVVRDVAALVEFQTAQGEVEAADAVGQRVGFASLGAVVLRDLRAQLLQSSGPEVGVVLLGQRQRV